MKKVIKSFENDQVATALQDINPMEEVNIISDEMKILGTISPLQGITFGNKIALVDIPCGSTIIKAGFPIGVSVKDIKQGDLVHVQNVRSSHIDIPDEIIKEIIRQMDIKENI